MTNKICLQSTYTLVHMWHFWFVNTFITFLNFLHGAHIHSPSGLGAAEQGQQLRGRVRQDISRTGAHRRIIDKALHLAAKVVAHNQHTRAH